MRKYLLSFLFITFTAVLVYAAPDPYAHLDIFEIVDKTFFQHIIDDEEATYTICIDKTKDGQDIVEEDWAKEIFFTSLNNWEQRVTHYINKNRRQKGKFDDILNILNKEHKIKQIHCNFNEDDSIDKQADLLLHFKVPIVDKYCGANIACYLNGEGSIIIKIFDRSEDNDYIQAVSHELGHAFGLADQYSGATIKGSFLYNSKIRRPSIMNKSKYITCDDADGLITVIDRLKGNASHREFYSLCKDGIFIKDGQRITKQTKPYKFKDNYLYFDSEVEISNEGSAPDAFVMDIMLDNFILSPTGTDLLKHMGFKRRYDYDVLRNIQVKIHGSVIEMPSQFEDINYRKTPIGLWTLVLYVKKGSKYYPNEMITKEIFPGEEDESTYTDFVKDDTFPHSDKIIIPLVGYIPPNGNGMKEMIRKRYAKTDPPFDIERMINNGFIPFTPKYF